MRLTGSAAKSARRAAAQVGRPRYVHADQQKSAAKGKNCPLDAFGSQMLPYIIVTPTATKENMVPNIRPLERVDIKMKKSAMLTWIT